MLTRTTLATAAAAWALAASAAFAQAVVTGTVKVAAADHVVIATASGDVDVAITPQTRVAARQDASPADIKPGAYLGTANVTTPDGGVASEVHLMASGPNVANTPMAQPNQVMTNGHVTAVKTTAKGQEIDVDYGGSGTRHVIVPPNIPMTRLIAATLAPGASVIARGSTGADGKVTAILIQVVAPK